MDIPANYELSPLDKAFITLTYPRTDKLDGGMSVLDALATAGVPDDIAGKILHVLDVPNEVRQLFQDYNMAVMKLTEGKSDYPSFELGRI